MFSKNVSKEKIKGESNENGNSWNDGSSFLDILYCSLLQPNNLGCYHHKNGKLRVVSDHSQCKTKEVPISWNVSSGPSPGWDLTGNVGTNPSTNFVGTLDKTELRFRVNNVVGYRIIPTSDTPNIVGGSNSNIIVDGVVGGMIGGGGNSTEPNTVNDCYSTIGGGAGNSAGQVADSCELWAYNTVGGGHGNSANNFYSTIGGGYGNTATEAGTIGGGYNNVAFETATVGGGSNNSASGPNSTVAGGDSNVAGTWASVGGGTYNVAEGSYSTIAGGEENTASGRNTMIPGGWQNVAAGDFSFAAGFGARANNQGCFVWNDNSNLPSYLDCNNDYRWVARASGGVYFYTNSGLTSGVYVAAGGGSWSSVSDRNMKANFAPVDGRDVLVRLASVPIATWNYRTQDTSIRHMGPTAQDLHAAFGLGESDKHINTIDSDGVALAAIQGLYKLVQEKEAEISALKQENRELNERMNRIEKHLAVMEIPAAMFVQK